MAKSVYQKKRRIAHFQNPIENFTDGECIFDYVSSIIQNMDDSFNSVHSSSKEHPELKLININGQRDSLSNANSPSTSNDSQNERKSSKSNKFSVSRKYPLMEKTQKILKQLKHNRRIPKPRAHLSSLPEPPLKKVDYKVSTVQKMKQKGGRKLKNNISLYNAHVFDDSILKTSHMDNDSKISNCKISENFSKVEKHGKAENTVYENSSTHSSRNDLYNSNRKTGINVNVEKNSLCNVDTVKDSENDTTDSEYERFVNRSKKGLQKKVLKKQKHSITKRKTSKMESTKISKSAVQRENIPKQYDSDDSDSDNMLASVSSNFKKVSPIKKLRVISDMSTEVETRNVLNEESEPEMFADDVCTRDSSLESDTADNETSITNRTKPLSEKNVCSMLHETNSLSDLSSKSDTLPDIGSFISKEDGSETSHLIVNNIVPNNSSPFSSHINTSDSDKTKPNLSPNLLVIDLCDSDDECRNIMFDGLSNVSIPKKEKCIVTDVAIDLCDSDNDDKNASTGEPSNVLVPKKEKCVINVNRPDSEEFELEIIEITPAHSSKSHCIISKASSVYDEACQAVQTDIKNNIGNKHMQAVIKTEASGNVHMPVTSDFENQNKKSDDSKYDAVYMTNICSDLKKDELVCPESTCSVSSVHNKNIKTEMPEIFIDSVKGVRYSGNILKMDMCHNYQHQKHSDLPINFYRENTIVKNECSPENLSSLEKKYSVDCVSSRSKDTPFSENVLKSFDICSNSKMFPKNLYSGTCDREQKFQELEQMNISHLLELFKKEFQTYQEIIQTEANVEASLKVLETHQAEKLKYIRSLVQKYVGSNQDLCKISGSSVKEQRNSILPKNETLNTFKTLTADKPPMFTLIDLSNDTEDSTYQNAEGNRFSEVPSGSIFSQTAVLTSKIDNDIKLDVCRLDELQNVQQLQHSVVRSKHEAESSPKDLNLIVYSSKFQSGGKQTLKLLKEKCNVCGKEAMAACQRCAKVFFCSHDCGKLFWINGHENECGK